MMTLEQINQYADTLDTDGMIGDGSLTAAKGPEEIIGKLCGIYQKIRPIMYAIGNLWLIPKKWRTAILSFMVVLDGLCPQLPIDEN